MVLDRDGQDISYLTPPPKRDIDLRRKQRTLSDDGRMSLARWLIRLKLEGQLNTLRKHSWLPRAAEGADYLKQCLAWWDIPGAAHLSNAQRLTLLEGSAARAYFAAWQGFKLPWLKRDEKRVPPHYRTFDQRESPLTDRQHRGPMKAADPLNAMLNYCYIILVNDVRRVLLSEGFDVDMGLLHADQRDALVYDVMEPLRGVVDDHLLSLLRTATLRYGDATPNPDGTRLIVERPQRDGTCRLHPELLRTLASTCRAKHRSIVALVGTLKYRLLHGLVS
jgi:CRISPR-associated endonuclease Cas1